MAISYEGMTTDYENVLEYINMGLHLFLYGMVFQINWIRNCRNWLMAGINSIFLLF